MEHPRGWTLLAECTYYERAVFVCRSAGRIRKLAVSIRYHPLMVMTLRTSDQQTEALRRQAAEEGRSMQAVALSAIDEYIARRAHTVSYTHLTLPTKRI